MSFAHFLAEWGLPALFVGTIAEGEAVAMLGGAMVHRHLLPFEGAALSVTAGAVAVDQVMFHLGRHAARFAFARRALARPVTQGLLAHILRRPALVCLCFRFVYGVKTAGAIAIGAAGVPALRFTCLDLLSAAVWAHLYVAVGFGAGHAVEQAFGRLPLRQHLGLVLGAAVVLTLAAILIARRRRR